MTRLFLRFYVGVVLVLIIAWLTQSWLWGNRFATQNMQVVRDVTFGGIRNARDKYRFGLQHDLDKQLLKQMQEQFDYPVRLIERDVADTFDIRLCPGPSYELGEGYFIMARVYSKQTKVLLFGPLPRLAQPSGWEVLLWVGGVFLLAAVAIALLLRPVIRIFQTIESAAIRIAGGDLSARVDEQKISASHLGGAFNNMASHTETLVKSQQELLQAVSHELRTPLSRIHFAIDLIRDGDESKRHERLDSLTNAADDLDDLVGELLSYVRLDGVTNQPVADVDLLAVVRGAWSKRSQMYGDIDFQVTSMGNCRGYVDPPAFERALANLISNAARHCKGMVRVSAKQSGDFIVVSVEDDGPGIAKDERLRALEPFVRLSESADGFGLGLSIVRRIVHRHGGDIDILDSELGGCRVDTLWPTFTGENDASVGQQNAP